jgi:hypothetical protein
MLKGLLALLDLIAAIEDGYGNDEADDQHHRMPRFQLQGRPPMDACEYD